MRRLFTMTICSGMLLLAIPAGAQFLNLTMTTDLYCGDPPVVGQVNTGWNVATTGDLCSALVTTGGTVSAFGVNLTGPTEITVTAIGNPLQLTILQGPPYTANGCVVFSPLMANPTLTVCLPAGYYPIELSTAVNALIDYQISVTCAPCEPVAEQAQAWGGLKSMFR
jgi:hypothetical protein